MFDLKMFNQVTKTIKRNSIPLDDYINENGENHIGVTILSNENGERMSTVYDLLDPDNNQKVCELYRFEK